MDWSNEQTIWRIVFVFLFPSLVELVLHSDIASNLTSFALPVKTKFKVCYMFQPTLCITRKCAKANRPHSCQVKMSMYQDSPFTYQLRMLETYSAQRCCLALMFVCLGPVFVLVCVCVCVCVWRSSFLRNSCLLGVRSSAIVPEQKWMLEEKPHFVEYFAL
jgi:hypothetical protein